MDETLASEEQILNQGRLTPFRFEKKDLHQPCFILSQGTITLFLHVGDERPRDLHFSYKIGDVEHTYKFDFEASEIQFPQSASLSAESQKEHAEAEVDEWAFLFASFESP